VLAFWFMEATVHVPTKGMVKGKYSEPFGAMSLRLRLLTRREVRESFSLMEVAAPAGSVQHRVAFKGDDPSHWNE